MIGVIASNEPEASLEANFKLKVACPSLQVPLLSYATYYTYANRILKVKVQLGPKQNYVKRQTQSIEVIHSFDAAIILLTSFIHSQTRIKRTVQYASYGSLVGYHCGLSINEGIA
jgi:hypothetical protein